MTDPIDALKAELVQTGKNCAALTAELYRVRQERDAVALHCEEQRGRIYELTKERDALQAELDELRDQWNTIEGIK